MTIEIKDGKRKLVIKPTNDNTIIYQFTYHLYEAKKVIRGGTLNSNYQLSDILNLLK